MSGDLLLSAAEVARAIGGGSGTIKAAARDAIAGLPVAALIADDHAQLVAANDAAVALTGYSAAELHRSTVPEITGVTDRDSFAPLWRAFVAVGQQSGTYELITKDGRSVPVEYAAATVAPGLHLSLIRPLAGATAP